MFTLAEAISSAWRLLIMAWRAATSAGSEEAGVVGGGLKVGLKVGLEGSGGANGEQNGLSGAVVGPPGTPNLGGLAFLPNLGGLRDRLGGKGPPKKLFILL